MITIEKLDIYNKYKGDGDAFVRSATKNEKKIINGSDFLLIDNVIQDLKIIEKGLASKSFIEEFKEKYNHEFNVECVNYINRVIL